MKIGKKREILLNSISYKSHSHHYYKITQTHKCTHVVRVCIFFVVFSWMKCMFWNSEIKLRKYHQFFYLRVAWTKDVSNSIQDIRLTVSCSLTLWMWHYPAFWPDASLLFIIWLAFTFSVYIKSAISPSIDFQTLFS